MQIVVLCVNLFYILSTVSVYKENAKIPGGLPGDREILKLSPMVSADQIVTGAANRLPDLEGKVAHQIDSFLHGSHFK